MRALDNSKSKHNQQGAVVIVALVILVILTIIGVALMESSVVQERMAGNLTEENVTFQAAEAALRAGEDDISTWSSRPPTLEDIDDPLRALLDPDDPEVFEVDTLVGGSTTWWNSSSAWWQANGYEYAAGLEGTNQNPYYMIEEYDEVCDYLSADQSLAECKIVYRVTAIAWGSRNNTATLLQSLYARRY